MQTLRAPLPFPLGSEQNQFFLRFYSSTLCPRSVGVSRTTVPMKRKNELVRRKNRTLISDRGKASKTAPRSIPWKWLPRSASCFKNMWWIRGRTMSPVDRRPNMKNLILFCLHLSPTPFPLNVSLQ